jgi:tryptophan halogenase
MKIIKNITIVGGGTAGYMTALAMLRNKSFAARNIVIKLFESPNIPTIRVGESTTGAIPQFLHEDCGIDRADFIEKVEPTKKLIARFDFGPDDTKWFDYSLGSNLKMFVHSPYPPSFYIQKLVNQVDTSFNSYLFNRGYSATRHSGESSVHGYHFENRRFIEYIKNEAIKAGLQVEYKTLKDAKVNEDGIECLKFDDGTTCSSDLYIDCTGFGSFLLGNKLETSFISYANRLPCNGAVVGSHQNKEQQLPGTLAEKMNAGWIWTIDHNGQRVRGYVFSDKFITDEEAIEEYKAKVSIIPDEIRVLKFKSGRREISWNKNVVGIGNSYAFVEPMEATALHHSETMIRGLIELIGVNPTINESSQNMFNNMVNSTTESIREFIETHYVIAHGLDTDFWKHMGNLELTGTAKMAYDWYYNFGPYISKDSVYEYEMFRGTDTFRWDGYFTLFMGSKCPTKWVNPVQDMMPWVNNLSQMGTMASRFFKEKTYAKQNSEK